MERKWWTLIVVCTATFMLLLDITIVNVALPKIATDLNASFTDIQWVIDAYALTLASVLLTTGSLADLFGRKKVFAIGLGLFSATSLLCGLSQSALWLIIARAGQGVGGAIMFSTAIALTLAKVNESRNPEGTRVDWFGTVTFTAALFLLVFGVIRSPVKGWGSPLVIGCLAGSAVLLIAFLISQFKQRNAMFDVTLFRKPTFNGSAIAAFAISASMFAMFLYLTIYLQTILGFSPLQTGYRFLPFTVLSFIVAAASGKLSARVPVRVLMGAGLAAAGAGLLLMTGLSATSKWTALLPGFIVAGAGVGLVNPALASTAIGVVPPERSGMASGINSTFRQVGVATGIAVLGSIFESTLRGDLGARLAGSPGASHATQIAHAVAGGGTAQVLQAVPSGQRHLVSAAIHSTFASAMNDILTVAAV